MTHWWARLPAGIPPASHKTQSQAIVLPSRPQAAWQRRTQVPSRGSPSWTRCPLADRLHVMQKVTSHWKSLPGQIKAALKPSELAWVGM